MADGGTTPPEISSVAFHVANKRASSFASGLETVAFAANGDDVARLAGFLPAFAAAMLYAHPHIAEGTDHLLFLLTLLLPAPPLLRDRRWRGYSDVRRCMTKIATIVTAFTIGHSITLAAGALDLVHVPSRPIETLIAVSILVSAVHAFRPLFPGREAAIAGFFGLIHGLAFATTLAVQLVVVMTALPSLILLSRTRLYGAIRTGGALFAGVAASGWIAQRLWDAPNPADAVVMALAHWAIWVALGLTLLGIFAWRTTALRLGPRDSFQEKYVEA